MGTAREVVRYLHDKSVGVGISTVLKAVCRGLVRAYLKTIDKN